MVAATYVNNKYRYYFFDKDIQRIYELITQQFPNHNIGIIDEDWNRRYYLVAVSSDVEPTVYYRYDSEKLKLMRIASISTKLANRKLAVMKEITYPARDQISIPAFLTLPDREKKSGLPTVILPHGGPSSRDVWDFDILAQFLAANGYGIDRVTFVQGGKQLALEFSAKDVLQTGHNIAADMFGPDRASLHQTQMLDDAPTRYDLKIAQ